MFLAANPLGTTELALDQEARAIEEELERCRHREHFQLVTRCAARPGDLLRELQRLRPTIVHFSGHGAREDLHLVPSRDRDVVEADEAGEGCLYFQEADGTARLVSTAALEQTFGAAGTSVKLVIFNACYSEGHAEALLAHVDCVVGMSGPIGDTAARSFAAAFYRGLGECYSVGAAFKHGVAAIHLDESTATARCNPSARLLARPSTDPDSVYLIRSQSRMRRCTIVINAHMKDFDAEKIARLRDELCRLTGDFTLEIKDVLEGSVRLEVTLSSEAAERLKELSEDGGVTHILGLEVMSICVHEADAEARSALVRIESSADVVTLEANRSPARRVDDSRYLAEGLSGGDLAGRDLADAHLAGRNLAGANLTGANLTGANLVYADLTRANLIYADLTRANLTGAKLRGAKLTGAILTESLLFHANLARAKLRGAKLTGAILTGANLAGANLTGADLVRANLSVAMLLGASLSGANLERANLERANLTSANLTGANLRHANLRDANLHHANLRHANLMGADLGGAGLRPGNLLGATWDGTTVWPQGFKPSSNAKPVAPPEPFSVAAQAVTDHKSKKGPS